MDDQGHLALDLGLAVLGEAHDRESHALEEDPRRVLPGAGARRLLDGYAARLRVTLTRGLLCLRAGGFLEVSVENEC